MYKRPIVPVDFIVPERLETATFVLRPLTVHDVIRDYDAVMSSVAELKGRTESEATFVPLADVVSVIKAKLSPTVS